MRRKYAIAFVSVVGTAMLGPATAGGQSSAPPCASNAGAIIDAPKSIAWGRTSTIEVFASTREAEGGVFTIQARDASTGPISHPAAVSYTQMPSSEGKRRWRLRMDRGDGDAVAALEWTAIENGSSCRARISVTIKSGRGTLPFISIGHERTRRIIFGHERPECAQTAVVSWRVEVTGPGGRVRESTADVCGKRLRRTGRNSHFTLTARRGAIVFGARRPRGTYRASYRVLVDGKVAVRGRLRVVVRRGRVVVIISIRRR